MNGQISMFDLDCMKPPISDSPVLLQPGQTVYKVIKGDIEKCTVLPESWTPENGNRGYRLMIEGGGHGCTWNENINIDTFTKYDPAKELAEAFLSTHEVIMSENIKPTKTVAYSYIRECDKRTMTAFYSELDNGMVYVKEFTTYHHILKDKNKAIKEFMKQQEFEYCNPEQIEYEPKFKNMYRCKNSDWDYGEAEYANAVG